MYASFLGISSRSKTCGMDIFHQPLRRRFFDNFIERLENECMDLEFYDPHLLSQVYELSESKGSDLGIDEKG
jgi:hypothetical protein